MPKRKVFPWGGRNYPIAEKKILKTKKRGERRRGDGYLLVTRKKKEQGITCVGKGTRTEDSLLEGRKNPPEGQPKVQEKEGGTIRRWE